jgi:hypothetical protein
MCETDILLHLLSAYTFAAASRLTLGSSQPHFLQLRKAVPLPPFIRQGGRGSIAPTHFDVGTRWGECSQSVAGCLYLHTYQIGIVKMSKASVTGAVYLQIKSTWRKSTWLKQTLICYITNKCKNQISVYISHRARKWCFSYTHFETTVHY